MVARGDETSDDVARSPDAVSQLESWLDEHQEAATERIRTDQTISHLTLATVGMGVENVPASLERLPVLDLSRGDSELRVIRPIGRGGMAEVQLARQRALHRDVAVKRIKPGKDLSTAASTLLREARVIGRLEHPNIVPVHLLGRDDDGLPCIVMKRVEGLRWRDLIKDRKPDTWRTTKVWSHEPLLRHLEILLEVCNAVHFAHSLGIVHRDIKPSNVMVGRFGEVYLLDWGVATEVGTAAYAHASGDGPCLPLGTPAFMAPEMADGDGVIDERTDVYQLGASLHEALTQVPRHPEKNIVAVLQSVLVSEPFDYPRDIPAELANLCNRAMARRPEERFQTVIELRDAVSHFLNHRGSLRLVAEANARFAALEALIEAHDEPNTNSLGDDTLASIRKLFTECRFAFKQALRDWPENDEAAAGLKRCIEAMARHELWRGKYDAAEVLLEELAEPDPVLVDAIAKARQLDQARLRDLDEIRHDLNIHVSLRQRIVLSILLAGAALGIGALFLPVGSEALLRRSNWTILLAFVLFGAVFAMVILFNQETLLKNLANRRVAATLTAGVVGMMATRTLAAINDVSMVYAGSTELLICGMAAGMGGATIDRGLGALAIIYVVGAIAVQLAPAGIGTTLCFVITQAVVLASAAYLWKLRGIELDDE